GGQQAFADGLAHHRERDVAGGVHRGERAEVRGLDDFRLTRGGLSGRGRRCGRGRIGLGGFHVAGDDAAAGAGRGDGAHGDAGLGGERAGQRRGLHASVTGRFGRGRGGRSRRRGGRGFGSGCRDGGRRGGRRGRRRSRGRRGRPSSRVLF